MINTRNLKYCEAKVALGDIISINGNLCIFARVGMNSVNFITLTNGNRYFDDLVVPTHLKDVNEWPLDEICEMRPATYVLVEEVTINFIKKS